MFQDLKTGQTIGGMVVDRENGRYILEPKISRQGQPGHSTAIELYNMQ